MKKSLFECKNKEDVRSVFLEKKEETKEGLDVIDGRGRTPEEMFDYMWDTFSGNVEKVSTIYPNENLISSFDNGIMKLARNMCVIAFPSSGKYVFSYKDIMVEQKSSYYYRVTWKKIKGMYVDIAMKK